MSTKQPAAKEEEEVNDDEKEVDPTERMSAEQKAEYKKNLQSTLAMKLQDSITNNIDIHKVGEGCFYVYLSDNMRCMFL